MDAPPCQVVWFKRDLRLYDHEPLHDALQQHARTVGIFILEQQLRQHPDYAARHFNFMIQSARELQSTLAQRGIPFYLLQGSTVALWEQLLAHWPVERVYSYQETGVHLTYQIDKEVGRLLAQKRIRWHEYPRNGVWRGLRHRGDWDRRWRTHMQAPVAAAPKRITASGSAYQPPDQWLQAHRLIVAPASGPAGLSANDQAADEKAAWQLWQSFAEERHHPYQKQISKPEASREHCSRLSPHLAWGTISLRAVYQRSMQLYQAGGHKGALRAFISRLHWHSHFIQKFEMEEAMEFRAINQGYRALEKKEIPPLTEAWQEGQTGIPLVDACMRCLCATGYLNFRMRAMLVSFYSHLLWQPWRGGVHHLARQFTDFHPGIHYPQFQMQSGVTGINTIRIYNPVKQGLEHDPEGLFIAKWVPEVAHLPKGFKHEPWRLSAMEQAFYGLHLGKNYPRPIVDLASAARHAREQLHAAKKWPEVQQESRRILARHTTARRQTQDRTRLILEQAPKQHE